MQTGGKYGMIVMNNYLIQLYERGLINMETVLRRCTNPEYVRKARQNQLKGEIINVSYV